MHQIEYMNKSPKYITKSQKLGTYQEKSRMAYQNHFKSQTKQRFAVESENYYPTFLPTQDPWSMYHQTYLLL